jgi:predicted deacylase
LLATATVLASRLMKSWTKTRIAVTDETGFDRCTLDSGRPGPHVVVFGGTHGDETEGVIAANRLAVMEPGLKAGRLEVVPVVHEAAYLADRRTSPLDGRDLARTFPGDPQGTQTQRLAHALHTQVLSGIDLLIDLHTSGQNWDIPFLAGYIDDGRDKKGLGRRAAAVFGADFIWRHEERAPGRTLSDLDAAIYTEAPCAGPTSLEMAERYLQGVLRVLNELGMLQKPLAPPAPRPGRRIASGGDVDKNLTAVRTEGLFIPKVGQGEKVAKGQLLGVVVDRKAKVLEELRASEDGWIVVLRRRPHVKPGDQAVAVAIADG